MTNCPRCGKWNGPVASPAIDPDKEWWCKCQQLVNPQTGWTCPKCGRVYAPWVQGCVACTPKTKPVSIFSTTNEPVGDEQ